MMLWTIKLLPFLDTLTQHIFLICQRQCVKSFNTFQLRALKMRLRLCALYVLERLVCALCKCAWAVVKATYGGGWLVYGPDLLLNQIWPDTPNFPTFLDFQPFSSSKTHILTYTAQVSVSHIVSPSHDLAKDPPTQFSAWSCSSWPERGQCAAHFNAACGSRTCPAPAPAPSQEEICGQNHQATGRPARLSGANYPLRLELVPRNATHQLKPLMLMQTKTKTRIQPLQRIFIGITSARRLSLNKQLFKTLSLRLILSYMIQYFAVHIQNGSSYF